MTRHNERIWSRVSPVIEFVFTSVHFQRVVLNSINSIDPKSGESLTKSNLGSVSCEALREPSFSLGTGALGLPSALILSCWGNREDFK